MTAAQLPLQSSAYSLIKIVIIFSSFCLYIYKEKPCGTFQCFFSDTELCHDLTFHASPAHVYRKDLGCRSINRSVAASAVARSSRTATQRTAWRESLRKSRWRVATGLQECKSQTWSEEPERRRELQQFRVSSGYTLRHMVT